MNFKVDHCESLSGITYRLAQSPEDIQSSLDIFFDHFIPNEPMCVCLGGLAGREPSLLEQMTEVLKEGVSLVAVDEKTGQTVGIRTGRLLDRAQGGQKTPSLEELRAIHSQKFAIISHALATTLSDWENFERHPDVKRIYSMFTLGIHKDWRGRGIAKELVRQAFQMAAKFQCQGAQVVSTNDATRHIFNTLGMTCVLDRPWTDIEVDDGQTPLANTKSQGISSFFIRIPSAN
eukprot:maker-scaffold591_size129331-snap-gene-0.16 protein:Tk08227 transcript:maker-scaffold591_size129331-snap-gene-0.16-mRNA-1 annotation:"arylalkylamine n-acetyltransferase 3"